MAERLTLPWKVGCAICAIIVATIAGWLIRSPSVADIQQSCESLRVSSDNLVIVPVPSLVATLLNREQQKGSPLTEEEVLAIRDAAECIAMPRDVATKVAETRGYDDIDPENAWEDWKAIRPTLGV